MQNLYVVEQLLRQRQDALQEEARRQREAALVPQRSVREQLAAALVALAARLAPQVAPPAPGGLTAGAGRRQRAA